MTRRAALVLAVLAAGCGGEVPPVGTREFVPAPQQWSPLMLEAYDLEPLNMLGNHADGCAPGAHEGDDSSRSARVHDEYADGLSTAFGDDDGGLWIDVCDRGRGKIGVPLAGKDELDREMAEVRGRMRRAGITGMIDFVAVPRPYRALVAAQERLRFDPRDIVISSGQDASLNALVIEVGRSVGADGWDRLRGEASRLGVNLVLVRLDGDVSPRQPL